MLEVVSLHRLDSRLPAQYYLQTSTCDLDFAEGGVENFEYLLEADCSLALEAADRYFVAVVEIAVAADAAVAVLVASPSAVVGGKDRIVGYWVVGTAGIVDSFAAFRWLYIKCQ